MYIHRFSSSHETRPERTCPEPVEGAEWVPLALPQFSGYRMAERGKKSIQKPQKWNENPKNRQ